MTVELAQTENLEAPFIWFGGKARAAEVIWRCLGSDSPNYVEAFGGTLAVLLARPGGAGKIETVNDSDCDLANFWRAIQSAPDEVAHFADWPVNEADLHARSIRMRETLPAHVERMHSDPDYFDAQRAGVWVWGVCSSIDGNWMNKKGDRAKPRICGWVQGQGVQRNLPSLGHSGRGIHRIEASPLVEWFGSLAARLRRVRVACGDWSRVLTGAVTGATNTLKNMGMSPCAVYLDPPYSVKQGASYVENDANTARLVREWAIEHGSDPHFRIALSGYEGEHDMPADWHVYAWKAQGGHGNRSGKNTNRERERIWFSPHCLPLEAAQRELRLFG
jgi:DNA adenine methylase